MEENAWCFVSFFSRRCRALLLVLLLPGGFRSVKVTTKKDNTKPRGKKNEVLFFASLEPQKVSSLSPQDTKRQDKKRRREKHAKNNKKKKVRQRGASEAKKYTSVFCFSPFVDSLRRDTLLRERERERERDCAVLFPKRVSLSFSTRWLSLFRRRRRRRWRRRRTKRSPRQRSSRSSATWRCAALPFSRFRLLFLLVVVVPNAD